MYYFELLGNCILEEQSFKSKRFPEKINRQVVKFNLNIFLH